MQYEVVGMTFRLLIITYFIVQIIYVKREQIWTAFKILEKTFIIKMISKSQNDPSNTVILNATTNMY